jgi:hypothetical protein
MRAEMEKPEVLDKQKLDQAERKIADVRSRMNDEEATLGHGFIKQASNLTNLQSL